MIICVAARMKSTRCPGKALADLYGKPLIIRLFERISKAEYPYRAILCTSTHKDDDILAQTCEDAGIEVFRGSEDDVMDRFLKVARHYKTENVIRVTGDNPLTDYVLMDKMAKEHLIERPDYTKASGMPAGTKCEIISVDALEHLHQQLKEESVEVDTEYMTYDLHRLEKIMEFQSTLGREDLSFTVDYPSQLEDVQQIFNKYKGNPPTIEKIISDRAIS
jgi:spore coat polysaccharide biosynthesis protein SpsF